MTPAMRDALLDLRRPADEVSPPWPHGAWRACGLADLLAQFSEDDRARHAELVELPEHEELARAS